MLLTIRPDRGSERAFARLRGVDRVAKRAIRQAWFGLGRELKAEASKEILRRPKGGRVYVVRGPSGRRRRHVASAPGETHANLSGTLRRSLGWKVHGHLRMDFGYGVDSQAPRYAPFVERGTRRMAARPSLRNAIDAVSSRSVERDFVAAMNRAMT